MRLYEVLNQTVIGNQSVLTLDKKRNLDEYGTNKITLDSKEYNYTITHNEYIICVNTLDSLVGKNIVFTN